MKRSLNLLLPVVVVITIALGIIMPNQDAYGRSKKSKMKVEEKKFPAHTYCGVRKLNSWNEIGGFCMQTYPMLGGQLQQRISGPAAGLYWTWDTVKKETDMAAVFPVKDTSKAVDGASFFYVPASNACMITYKGPYQDMMAPHTALMEYCAKKKMKVKLVLEEYVIGPGGPGAETDSTKFVTNIYYLCDHTAKR